MNRVGWVMFALAVMASSCGSIEGEASGRLGGPCYPNRTCDDDLVCVSNVCTTPENDAGAGDGAPSDAAAPDASSPDGSPPDAAPAADASAPDAPADVDECALGTDTCHTNASCTNTVGSYACACNPGFAGDGMSCADIDECAVGTAGCSGVARCVNKPGSYACVGDDFMLCLDGVDDRGITSPMTSAVATLGAATVELWFRSIDGTGERDLIDFWPTTITPSTSHAMRIAITDAALASFGALSGRVLYVTVDARDNGGALNARGFDIDASLPGFDERQWHHYAIVFTGATQRAFVDGVELTSAQQRDGAPNASFADAFGSAYVAAGGDVRMHVGWFARDGVRFAAGSIEDIRVSSGARYSGPFPVTYPLELDGMTVARYGIDEGSGTTSEDDAAGGYDIMWVGAAWGICGGGDVTPPETTIRSGPPGSTTSNLANFTFVSSEPGTFQCRLDGAAFAPCTSPASYLVSKGTHTFEVRAVDAAANIDPSPATWSWTYYGWAVDFDGMDDVLSSSSALSRGLTSTVTVEYWFRPDASGVWMKLLNIHNAADFDVDMEVRPDNRVYCTLFDQQPAGTPGKNHGTTSVSTLSPGGYYHIACTYDGATQRLFINGVLEASNSWSGQIQLNDFVTISGFESRFVNGALDEFRLSTTARYTTAFTPATHFADDPSTLVLWMFDEGSGATSADSSGNGFTARLGVAPYGGGPPSWTPSPR